MKIKKIVAAISLSLMVTAAVFVMLITTHSRYGTRGVIGFVALITLLLYFVLCMKWVSE